MRNVILITLLFSVFHVNAISVSISQSGTTANSCTRTLTANITGGSGAYTYTWSIVSPSMSWPTTNNIATVSIGLNQTADINVTVHDTGLNQYGTSTVTVNRVLQGSFDTFRPNLITPNGDGFNDHWIVTAADKTLSPINAYTYTLTIRNSGSSVVFSSSGTVSTGYLGIIGGDISWNGRLNGTGSIVSIGTYSYELNLQNCSGSASYSSSLVVIY